ncbi:MAG: hypothetical protein P8Q90_07735 [Candidatus Thalassarchaeaceae archaeon]|jgi:hypothetical protein|nr:hypothetical protein [Candidatus Thalassarchaeaceae archaeon]
MHISGKIGIPVGIVMLIIGGFIAASSFESWEEAEKIENFMSEPSTEIILKYIDEDEAGSAGWYLMIQAEYSLDNNGDDIVDACNGLNITFTDSQGNDMNSTSGNIYCGLDDNREMAGLDKSHVDINDGWMIVGIVCDTLDNAEMNGYWETSRNEKGEEGEVWVQTGENDRCEIGEQYTISSNQEMVLFDRDTQAGLEIRGLFELCGGLCCAICSLIFLIGAVISGFTMKPGDSTFTTMELGGASPVPVTGEGASVPGTTQGAVFGAGPAAQPMAVPLAEESVDEPVESSSDALKKKFLAAAEKITESEDPEKE